MGQATGLPFAIAVPFAGSPWASLALLAPMVFFIAMPQGVQALSFQTITPNELRGRVLAIFLLIGNMVAFTVAPTVVALISTYLLKDSAMIGKAMSIVSGMAIPFGILSLYLARNDFKKRRDRACRAVSRNCVTFDDPQVGVVPRTLASISCGLGAFGSLLGRAFNAF